MIDQLVNFVIRPPRAEYCPEEDLLGPTFTIKGRRYVRQDIELVNARSHTLQCSHYMPQSIPAGQLLPCVIYAHGNSGCRADANEAVVMLLPSNITVFTLDFSGSGLSGGEYVSLGHFERDDITTAVDHLRVEGRSSLIGVWGRSMGAVTALLYGATDPSIAGMVLDSPFASLQRLMMELVDEFKIRLPKFGVKMAVQYMRRLIRQKADFDIQDLDVLPVAAQAFIPVLIGHAEGDVFILPQHSEDIHQAYAGDKNMIRFAGDHNSPRPSFFYDSVTIFFHNVLRPPDVVPEKGGGDFSAAIGRNTADRGGSQRSLQAQDLSHLGIDLDDDDIDQATLYELLGVMGGQPESEETSSEAGELTRSNSSLGRGRGFRPPKDVEQRLDQARSQWHMTSVVVPQNGTEEDEREAESDLEKILASQSQIRGSFSRACQQAAPAEEDLQPKDQQDEEQMIMAAIALSLQDQQTEPSSQHAPPPGGHQVGNGIRSGKQDG